MPKMPRAVPCSLGGLIPTDLLRYVIVVPSVMLGMAVLTISDTRTIETDTSGALLISQLNAAGHNLVGRAIVLDDIAAIRAQLLAWRTEPRIEIIH